MDARMVAATGSDSYLRAFSKLLANPAQGHLTWTRQEQDAFQQVEQLRGEMRSMSTIDNQGGYAAPLIIDPSINITSSGFKQPAARRFACGADGFGQLAWTHQCGRDSQLRCGSL